MDVIDCLIVMGGPMGACDDDRFPWLKSEKRAIESTLQRGKWVIGICLGSQLIADVLGARVYANRYKEIGWFPIELTAAGRQSPLLGFLPDRLKVFHWHGDTFELPAGALHLAQSEACRHQAFVYRERVIGLQFHLETTPAGVCDLVENGRDDLIDGPYIQTPSQMLAHTQGFKSINRAMSELLAHIEQRAAQAGK
jgi:GMP synthase (glutamine-hydrolysing)